MGFKRIILLLPLLFLSFLSPVHSEIKKKGYGKYSFYSQCLDNALPQRLNNGLVLSCSLQAQEKLDNLINQRITSQGVCNEKYESHACTLKNSQKAFIQYANASCKENKYGMHYEFCEMMLKKDRLKWLDKSLGIN